MARVLLVVRNGDDESLIRESLVSGPSDFEIHSAPDGDTAVQQIASQSFDVALLDLGGEDLADTDASRLLDLMRGAAPELPCVVLVNPGFEWRAMRAMRAGATDFLVKRSRKPMLLARVLQHVTDRSLLERSITDARARLADFENRFVSVFGASIGLAFVNGQGGILEANESLCELLGYDPEELTALTLAELASAHDADSDWDFVRAIAEGKTKAADGVRRLKRKDGRDVSVSVRAREAAGPRRAPARVVLEITPSSTTAPGLRVTPPEERAADAGAYIRVDREGVICRWSSHAQELLGWTEAETIGRRLVELIVPGALRPAHDSGIARSLEPGHARALNSRGRFPALHRDGREIPVEMLLWATGEDAADVHVLLIDLSNPGLSSGKDDVGLNMFRTVFENATVGIVVGDLNGTILSANEACLRLFGYESHEMVGLSYENLLHPETPEGVRGEIVELLTGERDRWRAELRTLRRDGESLWILAHSSLVRDAGGKPQFGMAIVEDITRRRLLEERYRAMLEAAPDGMLVVDEEGRIVLVNRQLERLFGYTREELLGLVVEKLIPERYREHHRRHREAFAENPRTRSMTAGTEFVCARKDGTEFPAEISLSPYQTEGGLVITAAIHDVSRQRRTEARFRGLLEAAPEALLLMTSEGRIVFVNGEAERTFGFRRDDLIGERFDTVARSRTDPSEALGYLQEFVDRAGHASRPVVELTGIRRDGSTFPAEARLSPIDTEQGTMLTVSIRDVSARVAAEEAMRQTEARFRGLFEGATVGISIVGLDGRCLSANPALLQIFDCTLEEMVGRTHYDLVHPDDSEVGSNERIELMAGLRDSYLTERRYVRKDGKVVWLRVHSSLVRGTRGEPEYAVGVCEDITEHRTREDALRQRSLQLLSLVGSAVSEAITAEEVLGLCLAHICEKLEWQVGHVLMPDEDGVLASSELWHLTDRDRFSPFVEATRQMRFPPGTGLPGRVLAERRPKCLPDVSSDADIARREAAARVGLRGAICFPVRVGEEPFAAIEFFSTERIEQDPALLDAVGQVGMQLGHAIERKRTEAILKHHALHDPLTSLPNRILFTDRLRQAMSRMSRSERYVALLFLDVDGFKDVNDSLGHSAGDQVLVELAKRLRAVVRPSDTVARLGGDEFIVLCEGVHGPAECKAVARRVLETVASPFSLPGAERSIALSVGIALARAANTDPEHLLRNADAAMYRAKALGGGRFVVYDEDLRLRTRSQQSSEKALRRAVEQEELRILYQPSFSLVDGALTAVEALVRWQHPERGLLSPSEIIPIAEQSGLIKPLGLWVLDRACRQSVLWRDRFSGRSPLGMWVNLSPRQLTGEALVPVVLETLRQTGMNPGDLCLEITEGVLMEDVDSAMQELHSLRNLGVELSIDDFGRGYSSLSYLKQLPIARVKLDRLFVDDLGHDPQTSAIAGAVVDLVHALGLTVVAEGVETAKQLEALQTLGCDMAQGYYFARPQSAEAIDELIARGAR